MDVHESSAQASARPRVGHISFLNCVPIYWGLDRTGVLPGIDLVQDTPDRLSDALVAGRLDMGPISLVEYLRHPEGLLVVPDLAVGADGPVQSVTLVSRRPLAELDGRVVALGSTSRTSVLLARMLLEEQVGVAPRYVDAAPDLEAMLDSADAAVLIGDAALRATLGGAEALGGTAHDLADAWRAWTGLPMVFAVWAVREAWAGAEPQRARELVRAFTTSRDLALASVGEVAADAARSAPYSAAELEGYFRALDFRLQERQLAGLAEFARRVGPRIGLQGAGNDPVRLLHPNG